MLDAKCVIYAKMPYLTHMPSDTYMSYIDIALWVSKDAAGPHECNPMPLNNF